MFHNALPLGTGRPMHALLAAVALAYPGFHEAKSLEPAASFVARKPAIVWCANSDASWHAYASSRFGAYDSHGAATPSGQEIWLDAIVCDNLTRLQRLVGPIPAKDETSIAGSIEVLTHESIHLRGERDEGVTDCAAMHEMPRVAVTFFRVTAGKRLRALMAAAWPWHRLSPPQYQTVC
jgi:hypothetical protein